jgi:glycosyltransferase involved in cell wall biosynthesis
VSAVVHEVTELSQKLELLGELLGPAEEGQIAVPLGDRSVAVTEQSVWLALALLNCRLPTPEHIETWLPQVETDGFGPLIAAHRRRARGRVRVLVGGVVVDAHHTIHSSLATGIQRVARGALGEWTGSREFVLAGWDREYRTLLQAAPGSYRVGVNPQISGGAPLVPWRSTYLLPELAVEVPRLARIQALAQYARGRTGVIGFDCVPMTSSETTGPGMRGAFARNLATIARFDALVGISDAAAEEYRGWRDMLHSAGLAGPDIQTVALPVIALPVVGEPAADPDPRPLVLCVGSHEPRKNHDAVLFAAEKLWREGLQFRLLFCGGNSWGAEGFTARLKALAAAGRPVASRSGVSDAQLAALYRQARFTVFPSLNEGYGLPVAESLSAGTPVITSGYGSMRDIADRGGAELVDPRDDRQIVEAMRALLTDDERLGRLAAETAAYTGDGWGRYADEVWKRLVDSGAPR